MQVFDQPPPQRRSRALIYSGLALVTLALYLPALHNGFVEYDDQQYVTDNPHVQAGLTRAGFVWAFGFHAGNWHPLAWLSHMLDCQFFGARAWGHHLTSILLHTGTTLLLFAALRRMTGRLWPSAAVAALFAWHPLHVESVAWVAERKDVLCAFFWMATLWLYTGYAQKKSAVRYVLTLASFALCLMAKPMAVTLPFVLLLLDYWPLGRMIGTEPKTGGGQPPHPNLLPPGGEGIRTGWLNASTLRALLWEKVPFLILAVAGCALTLQAQQIAIVSTAGLTLSQRLVHTLVAYNHYFWAMFFPRDLAVYYPYVLDLDTGTIIFSGIVLLLVTALALKHFRARPWLIVGWLWFLGTLVPVIGLVQVGDQAWADRYTYLPLIGLFIPLVWLVIEVVKNKTALCSLAVVAGVAMLVATSLQLSYWKNTWSLFDHANKVTHENYMAVTVLASQLAKQGKLDEAMDLYHTALRYKPTFPETHFFLGNAFDQLGRPDDAVAEYEKALWFKPMQEQTHIFLGIVLGKQKKYDAAITNYEAAIRIDPDSAVSHNNLARIYHTQGRFDDAITHYNDALQIDPKLAIAHNNLGILLLQRGNLAEGSFQLREALRLNPTNSETQFNLALALNQQQQWPEAAELFAKTVVPGSTDPKAHFAYATALAHTQKTREAMAEYAAALLIQPNYPDALDGLAWILSTAAEAAYRNGVQAVPMAESACELTGRKDAEKLKTLAAAYAEAGRFAEAIAAAQEAQAIANNASQKPLADLCQSMLEQFKAQKPWR
ncbi:MAG TPA: tetratricopeptide repeat protein [Verrucomicrobiae bacterium]|nr:tetratricopeptide repeat protein [Verrucomicrobiae bacterium]